MAIIDENGTESYAKPDIKDGICIGSLIRSSFIFIIAAGEYYYVHSEHKRTFIGMYLYYICISTSSVQVQCIVYNLCSTRCDN